MLSASTKHLTLKPNSGLERFVIVTGKRVAKLAVHRNKLKRRLRELLREQAPKHGHNFGGVVHTKKGVSELTFDELKKEVSKLFI